MIRSGRMILGNSCVNQTAIRFALRSAPAEWQRPSRINAIIASNIRSRANSIRKSRCNPLVLGLGLFGEATLTERGRYPGWGPAGSVSWVPVIVTRQIYRLDLSLFNNRMSGMQVYKGTAYMVNNGQDIRMIIPNLANNIMQGFPMNNQLQ